jgi:hypothetical protein
MSNNEFNSGSKLIERRDADEVMGIQKVCTRLA